MTFPSGVLGNFVDNRIIFTANFIVRFSSFSENSLLFIFQIALILAHFRSLQTLGTFDSTIDGIQLMRTLS
jgi:hypothetical protein